MSTHFNDGHEGSGHILGPPEPAPKQERNTLSIVALVVSGFAMGATGWQAYEARQTRLQAHDDAETARKEARDDALKAKDEARRDAERARAEAKQAADEQKADVERSRRAVEASLEISRRTLILSERPLLEAMSSRFESPLAIGSYATLTTDIINTGKGPAANIYGTQKVSTQQANINWNNLGFVFSESLGNRAADNSRPTIHSRTPLARVTSKELIDGLNTGKIQLYVYGIVRYEQPDAIQPLPYRMFTYCYQYDPKATVEATRFVDCRHLLPPLPKDIWSSLPKSPIVR